MKLPKAVRFSGREWAFMAIAFALLSAGVAFSYWQCDATWVSRFGALVIIAGVLFTYSDLPDLMEERAKALAKLRIEFAFHALVDDVEKDTKSDLTQAQKGSLRRKFDLTAKRVFEKEAKVEKNRFLAVEVGIICVGTFANGCGQWVLEKLW